MLEVALATSPEPSSFTIFEGAGGLGGLGVLGVLGGHRRRRDFQTIPFGDLLGLLGRTDIIGPILRYISLCAYIGKDPLV